MCQQRGHAPTSRGARYCAARPRAQSNVDRCHHCHRSAQHHSQRCIQLCPSPGVDHRRQQRDVKDDGLAVDHAQREASCCRTDGPDLRRGAGNRRRPGVAGKWSAGVFSAGEHVHAEPAPVHAVVGDEAVADLHDFDDVHEDRPSAGANAPNGNGISSRGNTDRTIPKPCGISTAPKTA